MNRISLFLFGVVIFEGIKWWGGCKAACVSRSKEEALLRWKLASFIACLVRQARSWAQKASCFRHANKWRFDRSYGEYTEMTYRPLPLETLACLRGILKAVQPEQTIQQSQDKSKERTRETKTFRRSQVGNQHNAIKKLQGNWSQASEIQSRPSTLKLLRIQALVCFFQK